MNYNKIILALFLILAGWGITTYFSDTSQAVTGDQLSIASFLELDYIKEDPVIQQEIQQAQEKARGWQTDAKLTAVSVQFKNGIHYDCLEQYNYVFTSNKKPNQYWIVNNSRIDEEIAEAYADGDLFESVVPKQIDQEYLKINFIQALELVERKGGYEFRIDHAGKYIVTLLLVHPQNGVLNWHVSYMDETEEAEKNWLVNATNGIVQAQ
jgi:hypothetical protein